MDGGDWISLAGVIIAGGSAIWSAASAVRSKRAESEAARQAKTATQAAVDATESAGRSASAAERSAAALEQQNQMALDQAAIIESAPWSIAYRSVSTYELWNDSDTPKFHVGVSGDGVLRSKAVPRIDAHSSTEFRGLDASGVGNQVEVTWHRREDQSDTPLRWTGRKPPKP